MFSNLLTKVIVITAFTLVAPFFLLPASALSPTCPAGYVLSGNNCVKGVPKPTCPQGYTLSGNNCVKGQPAPSCPAGFTFSGGQCIAGSQAAPSEGPWVFIIQKALGVRSALELDGASVCTVSGTPSVVAVNAYFQTNRMTFTPVAATSGSAARDTYLKNACDVLITLERSSAPALRSLTPAGAHIILPERLVAVGAAPAARPSLPAPAPQVQPVNLAYPLQSELKRIGCLTGAVDGIWGGGSRAALSRFANRAGLNLGSEPSQNALNEARRRQARFCQPVRVAPKRTKPKGCRSGTVFLEGQCIPHSEVASFCGPGYTRSGSKCVSMAGREPPSSVKKKTRCSAIKFAFTRGNTCACSGGRIFTGAACEDPNDLVPVGPGVPQEPIGPGECRRMGNEIVCS